MHLPPIRLGCSFGAADAGKPELNAPLSSLDDLQLTDKSVKQILVGGGDRTHDLSIDVP